MVNKKIYTNTSRPLVIDDTSPSENTTYSSEKIEELVIDKTGTDNWQSGKLAEFGADGRLVNSGKQTSEFASSGHSHNASGIIVDTTNFGGFLPLGIDTIQKFADYVDDFFEEIQEQGIIVEGYSPLGVINGINTLFTITHTPTRIAVYLNGVRQKEGIDYTMSSNTINFTNPPISGDIIISDYSY